MTTVADTLAELRNSRAATKGSQTKLKNYVDANIDRMNEHDLATRLGLVETYFENFQRIQSQIERLDTSEAENNHRELFEDTYCSIKSKLLAAQASCRRESVPSFLIGGQNSVVNQSSARPARLPKLSLPRFSGKYTDWHDFYKTFVALVDNDDTLTTVEKFTHLRNCLGDVSTSKPIRSMEMTEVNYQAAIKLLKERYENKRIIFNSHIRAIHEIKSGVKSAASLRDLIDTINFNLRSLKQMGTDAELANALLLFIICSKLDVDTLAKFEETVVKAKIPTWEDLESCLARRCQVLEAKEYSFELNDKPSTSRASITTRSAARHTSLNATIEDTNNKRSCTICKNKDHDIYRCPQFDVLTPKARFDEVKRLSLCINCLQGSHRVRFCRKGSCRKCRQRHHTLLHMEKEPDAIATITSQPNPEQPSSNGSIAKPNVSPEKLRSAVLHSACHSEEADNEASINAKAVSTILATAIVRIRDRHGDLVRCRVLLDSGSQLSFISDCIVRVLGLERIKVNVSICGINEVRTHIKEKLYITMESCTSSYKTQLEVYVVPRVTSNQPSRDINVAEWKIPSHIQLADSEFYRSKRVDMLVGAEIFYSLLVSNRCTIDKQLPTLQNTKLGWIISGKIANIDNKYVFSNVLDQPEESAFAEINKNLERFWIMDGFDEREKVYSEEERVCEAHFAQNFRRDDTGRFVVRLSLKNSVEFLENNYWIAKLRFLSLERKLLRAPEVREAYDQCIREYETLNHMEKIETSEQDFTRCKYFLPHHCVYKPESNSTRLRIVFDASCRTATGYSLNAIMNVGPTIQKDLFSILLRFRLRRYALTADITKMYRQILVDDEQSYLQCILWRFSPKDPIGVYRSKTVTFGTAAASFLAIRCLHQLAIENKIALPLASKCIMDDFYVDDLLTGADTFDEALQLHREVNNILASAGFELQKWASNDPKLLQNIPPQHREQSVSIDTKDFVRTLGLSWYTKDDVFRYKYAYKSEECTITKRRVFSEIATLFDPLGILSPIIVKAKIFLQHLWRLKIDWDNPLPENYKSQWVKFREQLSLIEKFEVPRFVFSNKFDFVQLHGFSDACNDAYGCCIYIRCVTQNGVSTCRLLCAKSRVAPIKSVSLPRLELCAAELLANLLHRVTSELSYNFERICCWTDSEIVLNWLAAHPSNWATFVSNRVSTIQRLTEKYVWNHVDTKRNPADIVSRGMLPKQLLEDNIWFVGPDFLTDPTACWPNQRIQVDIKKVPERRKDNVVVLAASNSQQNIVTSCKFVNSFSQLRRVFAYVLRFVDCQILRRNMEPEAVADSSSTPLDLFRAEKLMFRIVQRESFSEDYRRLLTNQHLHNNSYIQRLRPFLDNEGIIRVGGRVQESNLSYNQMHPILLPKNSQFVFSLVKYLHHKNLHVGPQALLAVIRQQYWIINGRDIARRIVQRCIICFKHRPILYKQIMGNLPSRRAQPARPFLVSGVDFCGPVMISYKQRGQRPAKAYIAIFVCFTTKAVHLELVSNLSSDGFIAALKRFVSRRGLCSTLYCDNATNFVGGRRQLNELRELFFNNENRDHVIKACAEDNIRISHIPPRSPHFGGRWEAAVKSAKHHMNRMLINSPLTYEEFSTVLTQIEAVMNSRPLTPMSSDPADLNVLTPGHFLIGEPLTAPIEPDLSALNINRLSRYQLIRRSQQEFWERWSKEYIVQLQQRAKWRSSSKVDLGSMVLVSEDTIPPQKWMFGRIVEMHPGKDGIIRVVSIRTKNGLLKRSIQKLAPLPVDEEERC